MNLHIKRRLGYSSLFTGACLLAAMLALGQSVPQPVLSIAPVVGTNQVQITITNGVNINYELFWRPVLANTNYPWQIIGVGGVGQTNFFVQSDIWGSGFFRVFAGTDQDSDGIPDWEDADPSDATIGILSITIDSPTNGASLN